jgi:hypothetical protein
VALNDCARWPTRSTSKEGLAERGDVISVRDDRDESGHRSG